VEIRAQKRPDQEMEENRDRDPIVYLDSMDSAHPNPHEIGQRPRIH
jgi:hypothetical protein